MSDMTSLSSNYSATANFAKEFNGAVLVLKRLHVAQESLPAPPAEEEALARRKLAVHLRGIVGQLAPGEGEAAVQADRIPEAIISRLAEKHQSKMVWLVADLRNAQHSLEAERPLGEQEFDALDEVCDAADATASASFRRLWRR